MINITLIFAIYFLIILGFLPNFKQLHCIPIYSPSPHVRKGGEVSDDSLPPDILFSRVSSGALFKGGRGNPD